MKWNDREHICGVHPKCKRMDACIVLGKCLFHHELLTVNCHPQAMIQAYHTKTCRSVLNLLNKLRKGTLFNADPIKAQKHCEKIFPPIQSKEDVVKRLLSDPEPNFHEP